jgi:hypothetical protein
VSSAKLSGSANPTFRNSPYLKRSVENASEVFTLTPSTQQDNIAPGMSPDARIHATLLIYPLEYAETDQH